MRQHLYYEAALPRAQIPEIEAVHICRSCASKQEPRKNQHKISMARVIENLEVDKPRWMILLKRRKRDKEKLLQGWPARSRA